MTQELNLSFSGSDKVSITYDDQKTDALPFVSPLTEEDHQDIRWYLETYAALYTADEDDKRADRIAEKLPIWGQALFEAVFSNESAKQIFHRFLNTEKAGRLLAIAASHPTILSLPWELLRIPNGNFLVQETPGISIRRKLADAKPFQVKPKKTLRLLFVVSRPKGAGFLDPRSDPLAVLDALDRHASGQVKAEFLRPATLHQLKERLKNTSEPIDIVHFDGHGNFDKENSVGSLVFTRDGSDTEHLMPAQGLGEIFASANIPLVILSACQSGALGKDPMGTVAVQLMNAGIPSVIAMSHSVHVNTTRALFSTFYQHLIQGKGIAESLDKAREQLFRYPERIELQRGQERVRLKLYDWFMPVLYQTGKDAPLLPLPETERGESDSPSIAGKGLGVRFFGRTRELWKIEKAFVRGMRRITITGFGGQGKTCLAEEAAKWLCRTDMFKRACFVNYAAFQGIDALGFAVSMISESPNADAVMTSLTETPTLIILDNLEAISDKSLNELLDAALLWSEAGQSRVLLTTRMPDFNHAGYRKEKHLYLVLNGLGKEDALAYFQSLMKLPPAPAIPLPKEDELLRLFEKVAFHPLSIKVLAKRLKKTTPDKLGERLETLLEEMPDDLPEDSLMASLNLSLKRLPESLRKWLPKLGVFYGGALENMIFNVTKISHEQWQLLRPALENTGLIQAENMQDVGEPFFRFHPAIAPALWQKLSAEEKEELSARHRAQYYQMSGQMYHEDDRNPFQVREIVKRELPNLMAGVRGALEKEEEDAVDFVNNVNRFLGHFSLIRDSEELTRQAESLVKTDEKSWYLVHYNLGEQLYGSGKYSEAEQVFEEILAKLGQEPTYELCITLNMLGRCFKHQGLSAQAAGLFDQGLLVAEKLEESKNVRRQTSLLQTDLADVLTDIGSFEQAREAYQVSLAIAEEQNDNRQVGVVNGQLGTLAMMQGNLQEAVERFHEALGIFQRLNEPASESTVWNNLGEIFRRTKKWEASEESYRNSARIKESQGDLASAAITWNNIAAIIQLAGKPKEAEEWYRKAIEANSKIGNRIQLSINLGNLADLLQNNLSRLQEARQMAEAALAIKKTLDSGAAEIWGTLNIMAQIADKQHQPEQARDYRRQAREAKANFAGTKYELQSYEPLISAVIAATQGHEEAKEFVRKEQEQMRLVEGLYKFPNAIDRILAGERNEEALCENLNLMASAFVMAIFERIGGDYAPK